ncbi:MAG: type I pullulanase [Lachnospiraceae bacterium]|nr:type I pullulanase [Lachnospiraceae bacterium]
MAKNKLRFKALSVMLATSLVVGSFQGIPVKAEKGEGVVTAKNKFDSSYDSQNAYTGNDLGCTYSKNSTTFKVWSPLATEVVLCRYATGSDGEEGAKSLGTVKMTKGSKGVWSCTVEGDIVDTYYTYKVTANGNTKEAVDIYAKAVGVNGDRAMVVDLDGTDPANWDKNYKRDKMKISDISVWEIHVRDFSIDVSSGVSAENRGKYKAFTEKGTTINGEGKIATCVDYLKEFGVTHVQILPMYDYASVDETKVTNSLGSNYNWGYDPENYNAPEGSYSSNPYDGNVRIKEMKEMIQALHDAGIKVIMDVVYNHTYDTADSNFNKIMPDYYYKINNDMTYNNQSGCGNATRSESAMYNKFMRESLLYWAEEYNLDGFRFDLMGIHDVNTMNQIREDMDKKFGNDTIILYGEGWTGDGSYDGNSAHKANESKLAEDIGYFNDQIRDAIKGEHKFDGTIGLVQTNYSGGKYLEPGQKWPNNVFGGIMGSVGKTEGEYGMWRPFWSKSSNSVLAYCSAHDNLTLWDKLAAVDGMNFNSTSDKMLRMNKMAGAVTLISHGGYFMQAGEEFARTKNGDENSYSSPDETNRIDWTRVDTYSNIQQYYKGMLQIRNVFSGFKTEWTRSGDNWHPNGMNMEWLATEATGVSAFTMTNTASGEWSKLGVIINNTTKETTFKLGSGKWVVIADGNKAGLTKIAEYDGSAVKAAGKSVIVAVPKETFDANPNIADKLNRDTNKAPVMKAVDAQSVDIGGTVEFTVEASDADGDAITLSAKNVPEGAEFDTKTGKFTWNKAKEGSYKVTFTANDGKTTATMEVAITVASPATELKTLVEEVEGRKFKKDEFTQATWNALETALAKAKEVISKDAPTEAECSQAVTTLKTAYKAAATEYAAREDVAGTITSVENKLKTATGEEYDAAAIADAKTVVQESKDLLTNTGTVVAYQYAIKNLEEASAAVVSNLSEPQVKVSTSFTNPHIYIWTGSSDATKVEHAGKWPGTLLTDKDAEGNYVYTLPSDEKFNIIVNNGTTSQTENILSVSGEVTVKVTDTVAGKDNYGNTLYKVESESKPVSSGAKEVSKTSLNSEVEEAKKKAKEDYAQEGFEALQKVITESETVAADEKATQVTVNQQTRKLRASMLALVSVKQEQPPVTTPTPEPEITPIPGQTPDVAPSSSVEPQKTPDATVEGSQKPSESILPAESVKPGETVVPVVPTTPGETPSISVGTTLTPTMPTNTLAPITPEDAVISKITFSPSLTQVVNKTIKVKVKAEGGSENYKYTYEVSNSKGVVVASETESTEKQFSWKAKSAGTYTVAVTLIDSETGKETDYKEAKFVVVKKALAISKITLNKSKVYKGKTVKITPKVTGGKKNYKYAFVIKDAKGKVEKNISYKSNKTYKWKPSKTGKYTILVKVKDATKTVVKKQKTVKVVKAK